MKRLVATALAVSVALCLAACGNTQSGGGGRALSLKN